MVPGLDSGYRARIMATSRRVPAAALALLLAATIAWPAAGATPSSAPPTLPPDPPPPPVVILPTTPIPTPLPPASACRTPYLAPPTLTDDRRAALQRRLDRLRTRAHIPGISVAIMYPDGSTWIGTSGLADLGTSDPVTERTAFAIASISKTFTAALILALRDDGRLDLDVPVSTYLPTLDLADGVTIRRLLDHTSGLHDFFFDPRIDRALLEDRGRTWTAADALEYLGKPYFKPGKGWHYSNTNYLLLGLVAERVGGGSLAEQLRERFFEPFGLEHTYEQVEEPAGGPVAHGYRLRTADDDEPADLSDGSSIVPFTSVVTAAGAAGSLASTPIDLARWFRALYGGRVLAPTSLAEMIDALASEATRRATVPYGLGIQAVTLDGRPTLGHSGRLLGFRSVARWLPNERMLIVTLTNQSRADPTTITRSLLRLALTPVIGCVGRRERL